MMGHRNAKRHPGRLIGAVSLLAVGLAVIQPSSADADSLAEQQVSPIETDEVDDAIGFREGSVIVAPIPFSSPMIGAGLALGGGYLFRMDEQSSSSVLGVGALKSDNGSQAYGFSGSINFGANRWQASILAARADLNYDLITSAATIPLKQGGSISRLDLAYGFTPHLSVGLQSRYLQTDIKPDSGLQLPPSIQPQADLTVVSYGLTADYDVRDDDIYPTSGAHVFFSATQNDIVDGIGNGKIYHKAYTNADFFRALGERVVVAARLTACAAEADTPFYDLCSVGGTDSMRGFNVTQFLDERMLSAQLEIRARFTERLGGVAFGGFGAVGKDFDALNAQGAAGGLGLRYRVSKKFPVEFAVDVSYNDLDEQLLYIFVGQRF